MKFLLPLFFILVLVSGCKDDEENTTVETTADSTAPSLSDAALSASNRSTSSLTLSWTAASDDTSGSSYLTYQAYYSTDASMDSLSEVQANGSAAGDALSGIESLSITGLSEASDYYLNLVVTDEAGNSTVYDKLQTSTLTRPAVSSLSPGDGSSAVATNTGLTLVFSLAMQASSLTTNTSDTQCSGSVQLSSDGFSSCIKMAASPSAHSDSKTFSLSPAAALSDATTYKIKITTAATSSEGAAMAADYTQESGFTTAAAAASGTPPSTSSLSMTNYHADALSTPNGGESWTNGSSYNIVFNNTLISGGTIDVYILTDDPTGLNKTDPNLNTVVAGKIWQKGTTLTSPTGSDAVDPANLGSYGGNAYRMLLIDSSGNWDLSDANFSLNN